MVRERVEEIQGRSKAGSRLITTRISIMKMRNKMNRSNTKKRTSIEGIRETETAQTHRAVVAREVAGKITVTTRSLVRITMIETKTWTNTIKAAEIWLKKDSLSSMTFLD